MPWRWRKALLPSESQWKPQGPTFQEDTNFSPDEVIHVVVPRFGRERALYRFSKSRSLFVFGYNNPLRRLSIFLMTSRWFDWAVIALILINCVFIALNNPPIEAEYFFASVYTFELAIKLVARGAILQHFSYLKDPWNWLDFAVVLVGWLSLLPVVSTLSGLHSLRVLRALRPIAALPGLRVIAQSILHSLRSLLDVMILVLFFVLLTAITGMQLMGGGLRNKCVVVRQNQTVDTDLQRYAANSSHWYMPDGVPIVCGNDSGAQHCPVNTNTVCLPDAGGNPNNGYTNFDNIGWAMLAGFQLITMDFWEDIYNKVLFAYGWKYVIYFILVIFVGSYYAVNLTLAVVAFHYEQERMAHSKHKAHRTFEDAIRSRSNCVTFTGSQLSSSQLAHKLSTSNTLPDAEPTTTSEVPTVSYSVDKPTRVGIDDCERAVQPRDEGSTQQTKLTVPHFDFDLSPNRRKRNTLIDIISLKTAANTVLATQKSVTSIPQAESHHSNSSRLRHTAARRCLAAVVGHKGFEWTVTACIILNTVVMAMQHPGMNDTMERALEISNSVFTFAFAIEMMLKMTALGPKKYMTSHWNVFDGLVVVVSLIELTLYYSQVLSTRGLSVIRTFRLLRVLKLAQSWRTMRTLMNILASTFTGLFNVTIILFIIVYIFAVIGIHLFGDSYKDRLAPRWNFKDFPHSVLVVFRILCGEWIELLYETLDTNHYAISILFFIATVVIGNFVIMNLFIALLLGAFEAEALRGSSDKKNAFIRAARKLVNVFRVTTKVAPEPQHQYAMTTDDSRASSAGDPNRPSHQKRTSACLEQIMCKPLRRIQESVHSLVVHTYFESFILLLIFTSTITLAFEDSRLRFYPERKRILTAMNIAFTAVFGVEMLLKWIGLGVKTYFSSAWNWLDALVVTVSTVALMPFSGEGLTALRAIRTLRALRPLRAVPRWKGMKIVASALMRSVPEVGNVLLVCLMIWLIFSVIGVQLFGGKFYKCVNDDGIRLNTTIIATRNDCVSLYGEDHWINSRINFDHVGKAAIALFQVATFEGWMELMADAVDAVDIDKQPKYDNNFAVYLFFVVFIMVGSFVLLNLFIGVIVENFNNLKKEEEDSSTTATLLTPEQKKLVDMLKRVGTKKPKRSVPEPKNSFLKVCYEISVSTQFETTTAVFIVSNIIVMSVQHYGQSPTFDFALSTASYIFTGYFTLEAIIRLLGLRHHYFREAWNVLDFIIVVLSLIGIILGLVGTAIPINPSVFRAVRVLRIGRILRVIKVAKGLRLLLFTYICSLPAVVNVGLLLFTIMFIYAVVGMSMFGTVRHTGGIDDVNNFETFGNSICLLFRLSTGAGWNEILDPCMIQPPDCNQTKEGLPNGDCGQPVVAIIYFTSYVLITSLLIINVYVAILIDNYNQGQQEFLNQLQDDHIETFYAQWELWDPHATQFIATSQLTSFLRTLPSPLIPSDTRSVDDFAMTLDTPIYDGDKVHCLDLLLSLIINYHRSVTEGEVSDEEIQQVKEETEIRFKEIFPARDPSAAITTVSKTWTKIRSAIVIQRAFRKHNSETREGETEKTVKS